MLAIVGHPSALNDNDRWNHRRIVVFSLMIPLLNDAQVNGLFTLYI